MSESESDSERKIEMSVKEKEKCLMSAKKQEPDFSTMQIQDALVRNNWSVSKALDSLRATETKKRKIDNGLNETTSSTTSTTSSTQISPPQSSSSSTTSHRHHHHSSSSRSSHHSHSHHHHSSSNGSSNHHHHHHHHHSSSSSSRNGNGTVSDKTGSGSTESTPKKSSSNNHRHHHHHSSGSSGGGSSSHHHRSSKNNHHRKHDSDNEMEKPKEKVFDSDEDSDCDVTKGMTKDRKNVVDFMNTSTEKELLSVKTCSNRKAEAIMELRPFTSWNDMILKIRNHKVLSVDILNNCQSLLIRRHNLTNIMKKCNRIVQRLESAVAAGAGVIKQPSILNPEMKLADYQIVGLNWLAVMHKEETNGILADEMGLGKTIQMIAFLSYLKETGYAKNPHLIVVPSSTLDNWDKELAKWSPKLVVAKYYGNLDERKSLRIQWSRNGLQGIDVVLTTYHTVASTPEERKMFRITPIQYVIFDEAHMLKNMTTQRYAHLVRINAERRILLTGTPLQNNLLELMSLLCFVMPSLFAGTAEDIKSLFQKTTVSDILSFIGSVLYK